MREQNIEHKLTSLYKLIITILSEEENFEKGSLECLSKCLDCLGHNLVSVLLNYITTYFDYLI